MIEKEIEYVTPNPNIMEVNKQSKIPMELYIKLDQPYYSPKQELLGFLKLIIKEDNYLISNVEVNLTQVFSISSTYKEKNKTFKESNSVYGIALNEYSKNNKSLSQGIHLFPFQFKIPSNINPTFIYQKGYTVLLIKTYLLFSFFDFSKNKEFTYSHELFIITNKQFENKPKLVSNSDNEQERLKIIVNVSSDCKIYSIRDFINLKVEIINNRKTTKVEYVKFSLYVKVSLKNEIITEDKLLSTIVEKECLPGKTTTFYEQILFIPNSKDTSKRRESEMKILKKSKINQIMKDDDGYFKLKKLKSREDIENIPDDQFSMDFPPSIHSKYFECTYYIKVTLYLRNKILGVGADNRPRVFLFFKNGE